MGKYRIGIKLRQNETAIAAIAAVRLTPMINLATRLIRPSAAIAAQMECTIGSIVLRREASQPENISAEYMPRRAIKKASRGRLT